MNIKGTVCIIGGAEDKGNGKDPQMEGRSSAFKRFDVLKQLLPSGGSRGRIEVITTATDEPKEMAKTYKDAFGKIGYHNVEFLNIEDKMQARDPEIVKRIEKSHAVFFAGGDQFKLSTILGGTPPVSAIREKYIHDPHFVIAGTSAGAMAMSKIMIYEGGVYEALLKKDLRITSGLGIYDTCIIDTHFLKRGRFGRLAQAIVMNPETLGIGLGEDTVLVIRKGTEAECIGSGMVVVIDGNSITQTNITDADDDSPIYVENLKVHLLAKGTRFSIPERRIVKGSNGRKE
ncbi:MAG TPA: cyanophycinase [Chitinophagaceae bacterium]|jgi:cyanophycinase